MIYDSCQDIRKRMSLTLQHSIQSGVDEALSDVYCAALKEILEQKAVLGKAEYLMDFRN